MTTMTDHGPYIAAVEVALNEAGFETLNAHAEDHDPRGGAIQIDTHSPVAADWFADWDEVWLGWNEDRGWWVNASEERPDGQDPRRFTIPLSVRRVASPAAVVADFGDKSGAVLEAGDDFGDTFPDVDFPGHTFEDDDPAFELALARYREVPTLTELNTLKRHIAELVDAAHGIVENGAWVMIPDPVLRTLVARHVGDAVSALMAEIGADDAQEAADLLRQPGRLPISLEEV